MKNIKAYCDYCECKTIHLSYNKESTSERIVIGIFTLGMSELFGPIKCRECTECGEYKEYW